MTAPAPLARNATEKKVAETALAEPVAALPTPAPLAAPSAQLLARDTAAPASPARVAASGTPGPAPRPVREGVREGLRAAMSEGVSAHDVREYSMALGVAARRFKHYPALARERGWEGTAEVALNFNALLPMPEVVLVRSSGRTVLDEQAVAMMTQAAGVAALPEGLKGRSFRVPLPVKFSLEDG